MRLYIRQIIITFILACSAQNCWSQTRFNVRDSLEHNSCVFSGVEEVNGMFHVTGPSFGPVNGTNQILMNHLIFNQNGMLLDTARYLGNPSVYIQILSAGFTRLDDNTFASVGQTSDINGVFSGFVANFNSDGDTTSVILFQSPYIDLYNANFDFIAPLDIEPSTNSDHSFFIASNINRPGVTGNDCYIQRMTPEGEVLWEYIYATEADVDQCKAMLSQPDGGVMAAIWQFDLDGLVAKFIELDQNGAEISQTQIEMEAGPINDMVFTVGNSIIAVARSNGEEGEVASIHKFTLNGNLEWEVLLGDPNAPGISQEFNNIVHTQDGMYVAGGINWEYLDVSTDTNGTFNTNGWLVKIDDDGIVEWDRKYHFVNSPQDHHTLNDLKATSDGGYIFCGEATDNADSNPYSTGPSQQGWLVKVDEYGCLVEGCEQWDGINVIEQDSNIKYFKAGPNPANQFLNIYQAQNASYSATYELRDLQGKRLESFPVMSKGTTLMLDVSKYPSGNYVLSLISEGQPLQQQKVIFN